MTLDRRIKEQFAARANKSDLYNSLYSKLAHQERTLVASQLVGQFISGIQNKTVLEIGAGQGNNVGLLNKCGFTNQNIHLNELLPERISAIKSNWPGIKLFEGNAIDIHFPEMYDCIFQSTVFTSILNENDRVALASKMWHLLKPGGIILWYDFVYNNPSNPNVRKVGVSTLKSYFPHSNKFEIKKVTLAPPIGRRVGNLYSVFNMPFLRSHILAAFQKD